MSNRIKVFLGWIFICAIPTILFAQKQSKPALKPVVMLGHIDFREANIWVQWNGEKNKKAWFFIACKDDSGNQINSDKQWADAALHGVMKFSIQVLPGRKYHYVIHSGFGKFNDSLYKFNSPALWRWRASPPNFKMVMGSCHYSKEEPFDRPGKSYGDTDTRIFDFMAAEKPQIMMWLGDNIYLREPDWGSKTGIYARYNHMRQSPLLTKLLLSAPNYAIWDDHDFGWNDANASFPHKDWTLEAFKHYWLNPSYGQPSFEGITSWFEFGDAQFYLLDDRYYRVVSKDSADENETILGRAQLEWLKLSLLSANKNDWKIIAVGGQFLNTARVYENFSVFENERAEIMEWIVNQGIKNVIFLTGDRHHSELSICHAQTDSAIIDFTVSPLTSGVARTQPTEPNLLRVEGTFYNENRSYGVLQFEGEGKARKAVFILKNKYGQTIWERSFYKR